MPLISVIVPVYAVQGYLRECLDSILTQSFTDLELIAVDDRSPDHCPAILDEYAARDPRVQVIHLAENAGLGRARNAGLDRATGEYVWFVDSDDWIAGGALHAIATKLRQTDPDVLLVDHTRVSWLGRHRPSDGRRLLAVADTPGCFSLAQAPGLLSLFTVAWNKVVRRRFLLASGVRFDVGWYEDLPFTYPILVAADRIAALGRVCYHYRKRRQDAITQTRSTRHFEVFDQWSRVFERLDRLGGRADPFRAEIFARMVWHLSVVQSRPDRLPARTRRAFFHRAAQYYHRFRPTAAGTWPPRPPMRTLDRLRHRLIAADRYRSFRALRLTRLVAHRARRYGRAWARQAVAGAGLLLRGLRAGLGRLVYTLARLLPLDPTLAVYAAYWYRGYACNPAAIYEAARELAPSVTGVWVVDRDRVTSLPARVRYVVAGSARSYWTLARATWLVNNVNFPDFVVKRRGSVHVQTHHGTPVKVMGLDHSAYPVGAQGMDLEKLMRRCDRWDYSVSANVHSTEVWARAYPARYETLECGYPRNDRLALATEADVREARGRLDLDRGRVGTADPTPGPTPGAAGVGGVGRVGGRRVVLYAPTHREYVPGYQPLLDVEELADVLGPEWLVLLRTHYFYPPGLEPTHPAVRDVSEYPCVEDLLLAADVLITDYSSVMFDYAVLDRPVVIYAPDWDAYRRTRGVTFDLMATPPGLVASTPAELFAAFRAGTVDAPPAAAARARFRDRFCALDDGYAAQRVVRRVFADALADSVGATQSSVDSQPPAGRPDPMSMSTQDTPMPLSTKDTLGTRGTAPRRTP
jgi:CDP-glycerol glycerophosphotransferase